LSKTLLLLLFDSPFQHDSAEQVYEIAKAAINKGYQVNVFLMMDGVYNLIISQDSSSLNTQTISERLKDLIEKGAKITICRVCMEIRGLEEKLLPAGSDVGGIFDLSDMVANSEVVLNFFRR
jgi:tRNA 2-thiouridine synthesizing protein D